MSNRVLLVLMACLALGLQGFVPAVDAGHLTNSWTNSTISSSPIGEGVSIAYDSTNQIYVSYQDKNSADLKLAINDGQGWNYETVDSQGTVGEFSSIAIDSDDTVWISYYDETQNSLKAARGISCTSTSGCNWSLQTIHTGYPLNGSAMVMHTSIALDSDDTPGISYIDSHNSTLRYAVAGSSSWILHLVEENIREETTSLAFDVNDKPHIAYTGWEWYTDNAGSTYGHDVLRHAALDSNAGSGWQITTVDNGTNSTGVGLNPSLMFDSNGTVAYITYSKYNQMAQNGGAVKMAYLFTSLTTLQMGHYTINNTGQAEPLYTAVEFDSNNDFHVVYGVKGTAALFYFYATNGTAYTSRIDESQNNTARYISMVIDSDDRVNIAWTGDGGWSLSYSVFDASHNGAANNDSDGDGVFDTNDWCPTGETNWTSTSTTDWDGDGCRDSTEDSDDDNDGMLDTSDYCSMGDTDWISTSATDWDGDGCRDSNEDLDDDNDGTLDLIDDCPTGDVTWTSTSATDWDGDGCRDSTEDLDDDNDGTLDLIDDCPTGDTNWAPSNSTDWDEDGCLDYSSEDLDDDNDGTSDSNDNCQFTTIGDTVDIYGCSDSQNSGGSADSDGDGVLDETDLCADGDSDWTSTSSNDWDGDGCRDSSEDIDWDNDGTANADDECQYTTLGNTVDQYGCSDSQNSGGSVDDLDGDGVMDISDYCHDGNTGWTSDSTNDYDGDGCRDATEDWDDDNDAVDDSDDQCYNGATGWYTWETDPVVDHDHDGCRDSDEDDDDDNDGFNDATDLCQLSRPGAGVDGTGCEISFDDQDDDGIADSVDHCSDTESGREVDWRGCTNWEDDDDDGVENWYDSCPNSSPGEDVDSSGCSNTGSGDDLDLDGIWDENDQCPDGNNDWTSEPTNDYDADGCKDGTEDYDDDNDGVEDGEDLCYTGETGWDTNTRDPVVDHDHDGCLDSTEDDDDDNDGYDDPVDTCPLTRIGAGVDTSGCETSFDDQDGDGVADSVDDCDETDPGREVDWYGCEIWKDQDEDDIPDWDDNCPDTPIDTEVDEDGCLIDDTVLPEEIEEEVEGEWYGKLPFIGEYIILLQTQYGQYLSMATVGATIMFYLVRAVTMRSDHKKNKRVSKFKDNIRAATSSKELRSIQNKIERAEDKRLLPEGAFGDLLSLIEIRAEDIGLSSFIPDDTIKEAGIDLGDFAQGLAELRHMKEELGNRIYGESMAASAAGASGGGRGRPSHQALPEAKRQLPKGLIDINNDGVIDEIDLEIWESLSPEEKRIYQKRQMAKDHGLVSEIVAFSRLPNGPKARCGCGSGKQFGKCHMRRTKCPCNSGKSFVKCCAKKRGYL